MKRVLLFVLSLLMFLLTACGKPDVNNHTADYESTMMSDQNPYFLEQEMKYVELVVRGSILGLQETRKRDSGIENSKVDTDFDVTPAIVKISKVLYGKRPTSDTITLLQHGSTSGIESKDFVKKGDEVILLLMKTMDGFYWSYSYGDGIWQVKDGIVTSKATKELLVPFNNRSVEEFQQIISTAVRNSKQKDPAERFTDILQIISDHKVVEASYPLSAMQIEYPDNLYAYKSQIVGSLVLLAERKALESISESLDKGNKLRSSVRNEVDSNIKEINEYMNNNMITSGLNEHTEDTVSYVIDHFSMEVTKEKVEHIDFSDLTIVNPLQAYEEEGMNPPNLRDIIIYFWVLPNKEFKIIYQTYFNDGKLDYIKYFNEFANVFKEFNSPLAEDCEKIAEGLMQ
ncbi:hypothetical protein [Paenibacillus sp. OV219]|uniref:hypothetical protein n=1 Tax=Paenibacillus sp. OV219 TaxID=1884377 RepID=UPI0008CB89E0|nr:hypothetical protein [Paenibacillus sp. OV219]SEN94606.1 hypothetical protein SAMN05518847_10526 [Paenibacillus sp. OV219]